MATTSELLAIGLQHHEAERLQEAEEVYRRILKADPRNADAWHYLGMIAYQSGDAASAATNIEHALKLNPNLPEAHNNLGIIIESRGETLDAVEHYRQAIVINPDFAEAYNNLGVLRERQEEFEEAIACYRKAVDLKPTYAQALNNMGKALTAQGRAREALGYYERAIQAQPNYAEAFFNLGNAYRGLELTDESISCYRNALRLNPRYTHALVNLGNRLREQAILSPRRDFTAAMHCYDSALSVDPKFAEAHYSRATLQLLVGDWANGWAGHERRWGTGLQLLAPRTFQQPQWKGEPLAGKTIFIHAEQGLGDTLQFVRYVSIVKLMGPSVIMECPPPLANLLSTCRGIDRLIVSGDEIPGFDYHVPLLSLPYIFNTTPLTAPNQVPYLYADPNLVGQWRKRLEHLRGYRIGINWRGRTGQGPYRRRDIPLECLVPLSEMPGVNLISLQKDGHEQIVASPLANRVFEPSDDFDTFNGAFMDTAAVMNCVDLVISSDTSVSHLAGALGVQAWLVLPSLPDWRWLLDRSDSPWYPTMRLFRQTKLGDWQGPFEEIEAALRDAIQSKIR
jgi:tetratricopeptide (TPR) repeat protein